MLELDIPDHWEWRPIQNLGEWKGGGTPKKSNPDYWDGGKIPWVSPKDMKQSRIRDTQDAITEFALEDTTAKLVPEDSIIIVTRSGILEHSLPVAVNHVPVTVNQDLKAFIPNKEVSSEYLLFFFQAFEKKILNDCSKDGTTVASINSDSLYEYEIPLPPLKEQNQIVQRLDQLTTQIDAGISTLKESREQINSYELAVISAAINGELTESWRDSHSTSEEAEDIEKEILEKRQEQWESLHSSRYSSPEAPERNLEELPDGWTEMSVEELSYKTRYGTSEKCDYDFDGPPVLRIPNIESGSIDLEDMKYADHESDLSNIDPLSRGDFLVVRTNGSKNLIGRAGLVEEDFESPHYFASYLIRFRLVDVGILPEWINLVWQGPEIRSEIVKKASTSAGQYNLSQSKILDFQLPIPPETEQREILRKVEHRLSIIEDVSQMVDTEIQRASNFRVSVLRKGFRGDLTQQSEVSDSQGTDTENEESVKTQVKLNDF
jgi:type I restriction enzyme S subunit